MGLLSQEAVVRGNEGETPEREAARRLPEWSAGILGEERHRLTAELPRREDLPFVGQRERQGLELHRQVDVSQGDLSGQG